MYKTKNLKLFLFLTLGILFVFTLSIISEDKIPNCELPVLTTSAGQSADINTLNVILDQAGVKYDYCDVPTVKMIEKGVGLGGATSSEGFHVEIKTDTSKFKKGTPYKTMIFAIGASLKGMGASGLTIEEEIKRLNNIIDYCKKNNIFIIATHLGGESKRGASGSDNEKMISTVAPNANYIIVVENSNKDGRFTNISKEKGTPLTEVKYALNIVELMKKVFKE